MPNDSGRRNRSLTSKRLRFENLEERVVLSTSIGTLGAPVSLSAPTAIAAPQQATEAAPDWILDLTYQEFGDLDPALIHYLSPEQIATIPNENWLRSLSYEARENLTVAQVQALQVDEFGIDSLPPKQISYLSTEQIHALEVKDFPLLGPNEIVRLTPEQIGSISTLALFYVIPAESRAALNQEHIQALDIGITGIRYLTGGQRTYLTPQQIKQVEPREFLYLTAEQVPHLTLAQMASIEMEGQFYVMSNEAQAALSREQLLSIPLDILAHFLHPAIDAPGGFVNPLDIPAATDGLAGDARTLGERNNIFALVPHAAATHDTVRSGNWSSPATWRDGRVPGAGADVLIAAGHTVTFDSIMSQAIDTLRIDGELQFAHNRNTLMRVDTIVVDTRGVLHIGTMAQPIAGNVQARIVFSAGAIDTAWDPRLISRGLISRGEVRIFGQTKTSYAAFRVTPEHGAMQLVFDQVPQNWNVGDELVVTGVGDNTIQEEYRTILGISGDTVTVAELDYNHHPPAGYGLSVYVANISRNVIIESANPDVIAERGHIMFAHNPNVQIAYAALRGLGRTDKSQPINDSIVDGGVLRPGTGLNPRARYPVHFHRTGVDASTDPAIVRGVVVDGSPGWGLVNHSSHVVMEDNVAIDVVGAAFATEDGNEVGSFRRNLAIRSSGSGDSITSRIDLHDFGHSGHGFWLQGPGVEVADNIVVGAKSAYVYFTASSQTLFSSANLDDPSLAGGQDMTLVSVVPVKRFSGNVAYASGRGLEIWRHQLLMTDAPSVFENFTTWNLLHTHVDVIYSSQVTFRNFRLIGNVDAPSSLAISSNDLVGDMNFENTYAVGFFNGIDVPRLGTSRIEGGHFAAVRAVWVETARESTRTLLITDNPVFETLTPSQLAGRQQYDVYFVDELGEPDSDLAGYFRQAEARLGTITLNGQQIYYTRQARNHILFPADAVPSGIPLELIGKTNHQLFNEFGIAPAGVVAPGDAVTSSRISGLLGSVTPRPVELELVSAASTNQLADYELRYLDQYGDEVVDPTPVNLQLGWNLLTRDVDGRKHTFFVFGNG